MGSGPPAETCAPTPTEHLYTQHERDAESNNDYFGARYYSSDAGRFLSPDWSANVEPVPYAKLDDPQSLNLYDYVRGNPLASVDADGHGGGSGNPLWADIGAMDPMSPLSQLFYPLVAKAQQEAKQKAQQQNGGSATASGIAGILCGETCGEKDSKTENESLDNARDKIAHVRLNGVAKWGANVDKHAGMAPPNMQGAKAMLPIAERAIREKSNGVDPTHGALLYNMRTAAQVKAGHDFWGYKVNTVSGPYNTPSPYKYIVTYGP